ncbi:hypothetical protein ACFW04_014281 [Cataglyphis niger]
MGSPLSLILADIVMDDLETHCLDLLSFAVPVYYRYVDDIFAIVPRAKVDEINVIFNKSDSCINFLNTSVIRSNGKIVTNWYRKSTCPNRYINFYSNHSFKYKINIIFNFVDHAILLSDDQFHGKNIDVVKQILLNNCFPTHVINRYIYKRLNFLKHRVNSIPGNGESSTEKPSYIALPFVEGLSDDIGRMFKNMEFTVVYNIFKKLNSLIKSDKDGLPISNRTEVVYKINCKNCSASYIGQTKRHLSTRREIAKMFFIKKFNNTINFQKDTENLNNIYDKLIKVV